MENEKREETKDARDERMKKMKDEMKEIKKERCSRSYHLAVGFLVIKDDSISERPRL